MRKLFIPLLIAFVVVGAGVLVMVTFTPRERRRGVGSLIDLESARRSPSPSGLESVPAESPLSLDRGQAEADDKDQNSESKVEDGPQLHGKVMDEDGNALAGAKVYLFASEDGMRNGWDRTRLLRERLLGREGRTRAGKGIATEATTQSEGLYSIPIASIPPGTYEVLARHKEHSARSESWARTEESAEIDFRLGSGESISGSVLDPDGQPVRGALVDAFLEEEVDWRSPGQGKFLSDRDETDSEGRFRLWASAGSFKVVAKAEGFSPRSEERVSPGTRDLEIMLGPGGSLVGRVLDEKKELVSEARVSLFKSSAREGMPPRGGGPPGGEFGPGANMNSPDRMARFFRAPESIVETESAGRFQFDHLPPGRYVLLAEKAGFVPAQDGKELKENIDVVSTDLSLAVGVRLSGSVADRQGKPVPKALVAVAPDSPEEAQARERWRERLRGGPDVESPPGRPSPANATTSGAEGNEASEHTPLSLFRATALVETDAAGRFQFDTLPAGLYSLSIQSDDFLPQRQNALEVKEAREINVILESGIRLEGKILSSVDGRPVPGAKIRLRLGNELRREAQSDADGHYKIAGLAPGRVGEVELNRAGFSLSLQEGFEVLPSPDVQVRDFRLDASSMVGGLVTDARGQPVPNARVRAAPFLDEEKEGGRALWQGRRLQMLQAAQGRTDADGQFLIKEVNAAPSLQVSIEHADFKPFRSDPFSVKPGAELKDLRFTLQAGGKLEVLVLSPDAAQVAGAAVRIEPERSREAINPPSQDDRPGDRPGEQRGPAPWRGPGAEMPRGTGRSTGADGKAFFSGLEDGEYKVSVLAKSFQPLSSMTSVVADQTTRINLQLLAENVITGLVEDSGGTPIGGARVEALRDAPGGRTRFFSEARSDDSGAFRLGSLGDGAYKLRFRKEGFAERILSSVDANTEVRASLERLGGISGHVLVAETGQPVEQFQVRLKRDEEARTGRDRKNFSDPGGAFTLANIAPGSYLLQVTAEGQWGAEVRVKVEDGLVTEGVEVLLVEGLSVTGIVQEKGTLLPVAGADIVLLPLSDRGKVPEDGAELRRDAEDRRAERERRMAERRAGGKRANQGTAESELAAALLKSAQRGGNVLATTDDLGGFQLKEVPPGRYVLVVNHDQFVPARQNIVIGEDRMTRAVGVQLEKGENLSGTVSFQDGSSAAGATVSLRDWNGLVKRAQTDGTGKYYIQGLLEGTYSFSVRGASDVRSQPYEVKIAQGSNRLDYRIESVR